MCFGLPGAAAGRISNWSGWGSISQGTGRWQERPLVRGHCPTTTTTTTTPATAFSAICHVSKQLYARECCRCVDIFTSNCPTSLQREEDGCAAVICISLFLFLSSTYFNFYFSFYHYYYYYYYFDLRTLSLFLSSFFFVSSYFWRKFDVFFLFKQKKMIFGIGIIINIISLFFPASFC